MAKVTRQIKVTLTKSLANHYGNGAGDEIQWGSAAEIIRVLSRPSIFRRDQRPMYACALDCSIKPPPVYSRPKVTRPRASRARGRAHE
jgi:hypothetical protein